MEKGLKGLCPLRILGRELRPLHPVCKKYFPKAIALGKADIAFNAHKNGALCIVFDVGGRRVLFETALRRLVLWDS